MAELSEYDVELNGVQTRLLLSKEDAEKYDNAEKAEGVAGKARPAAQNKARTASSGK